jgi:hypothetical protein
MTHEEAYDAIEALLSRIEDTETKLVEARRDLDLLRSRPNAPEHQEHRRGFYRYRGLAGHFGRACEDLDELDRDIATSCTVALDKRNQMRRTLACIRGHLLEAYDDATGNRSQEGS